MAKRLPKPVGKAEPVKFTSVPISGLSKLYGKKPETFGENDWLNTENPALWDGDILDD